MVDNRRSIIIHRGAAKSGMNRMWKEHVSSSMLSNDKNAECIFHIAYPNINCDKKNTPQNRFY